MSNEDYLFMGRRYRENEVSELLSLGISGTEIARMNKDELEDMVDDIKQTMIREFRAAYNSTITKKNWNRYQVFDRN